MYLEVCAFVVYLEVHAFEGFCICIGLPGLFQCWPRVIKNRNRPPVVISVVLSKAKNQFWYTLVPWMGVSKESNNRLL